MRVAFVSHTGELGGAELALLELIDGLLERGVECRVVLPDPGAFADALEARGVPTRILPFAWWIAEDGRVPRWRRGLKTVSHPIAALAIARQLRRWRCDVVCTNTIAICAGALAARLARRPHVWLVHEFGEADHGMTFDIGRDRAIRLMDRLSAAFVMNSGAVAESFRPGLTPGKTSVISYAVAVPEAEEGDVAAADPFAGAPADAFRCVMVGRLHESKGQHVAIRALGDLARRGIDARLLLVGDGPATVRDRLRAEAEEAGVADRVLFHGYSNNPTALIRAADALLMCSRAEAFGRVTIEACKVGRPVVGARSGGTPELVRHGFNGLLFEPGDPRDLADAIATLAADRALRDRLGRNAREWAAAHFTREAYAAAVHEVLGRAAERTGRG
jgi:glycosyltransferase involved in cell wall biosynthesis